MDLKFDSLSQVLRDVNAKASARCLLKGKTETGPLNQYAVHKITGILYVRQCVGVWFDGRRSTLLTEADVVYISIEEVHDYLEMHDWDHMHNDDSEPEDDGEDGIDLNKASVADSDDYDEDSDSTGSLDNFIASEEEESEEEVNERLEKQRRRAEQKRKRLEEEVVVVVDDDDDQGEKKSDVVQNKAKGNNKYEEVPSSSKIVRKKKKRLVRDDDDEEDYVR